MSGRVFLDLCRVFIRFVFWLTVSVNLMALGYLLSPYGAELAHRIDTFAGALVHRLF